MAKIVLKDAYFDIDGVDLSDHVKSISFPLEQAQVDKTAMGDTYLANLLGFKNASFTVEFVADYAAAETDATLWGIYDGDAAVAFIIKPNGAVTGASNPKYTGNCIMTSYTAVDGSVGETAAQTATFQVDGAVARAVAD